MGSTPAKQVNRSAIDQSVIPSIKINSNAVLFGDLKISLALTEDSIWSFFGKPDRVDSLVNRKIKMMVYDQLGLTFYFNRKNGGLTQVYIALEPSKKNYLPQDCFKNELTINGKIVNSKSTANQFKEHFPKLVLHEFGFHHLYFGDWDLGFGFEADMNSNLKSIIVDFYLPNISEEEILESEIPIEEK